MKTVGAVKPKQSRAKLPSGVKVIPAPKTSTHAQLLAGPDITTSGGCRTVHKPGRTTTIKAR